MSSPHQVTISATYTCTSTPEIPPTLVASAQVSLSSPPQSPANANIMHGYVQALVHLQDDINTHLTASLHLDQQSTPAGSNKQQQAANREGDDEDQEDEDEVEDQEDDIDDKHTLPAGALGAPDAGRAQAATNKRPRLD